MAPTNSRSTTSTIAAPLRQRLAHESLLLNATGFRHTLAYRQGSAIFEIVPINGAGYYLIVIRCSPQYPAEPPHLHVFELGQSGNSANGYIPLDLELPPDAWKPGNPLLSLVRVAQRCLEIGAYRAATDLSPPLDEDWKPGHRFQTSSMLEPPSDLFEALFGQAKPAISGQISSQMAASPPTATLPKQPAKPSQTKGNSPKALTNLVGFILILFFFFNVFLPSRRQAERFTQPSNAFSPRASAQVAVPSTRPSSVPTVVTQDLSLLAQFREQKLLVVEETFNTNDSNWGRGADYGPQARSQIVDGRLMITFGTAPSYWLEPWQKIRPNNYVAEIEVSPLAFGSAGGLILDFLRGGDYYRILVADGQFAVEQVRNYREISPLVNWSAHPAIQAGQNKLTALQRGDLLSVYVNDTMMTELRLQSLQNGYVGVIATSDGSGDYSTRLDNFRMWQLP
jgi:hypothetical protein